MKKLIISLFALLTIAPISCAREIQTNDYTLSNKEIKQELNTIKTRRLIIANALLLTDIQKAKAEQIYGNVVNKEAILYAQLKKEKNIYNSLSKKDSKARKQQRQAIDKLNKDIYTLQHDADKDFKSILSHDQRVKFKRLKNELKSQNR